MTQWGMPYSGSKNRIIESIALNFPKADHFYDLFGGGGSVTHFMALKKRHWYSSFHYNEIQNDVFSLFKNSIEGKYNYDRFNPPWVSREEFFKRKESDPFIKYCYSFSNNGSDYQFNVEIEPFKKSAHQAIVFDLFDDFSQSVLGFCRWPAGLQCKTKRRLFWIAQVKKKLKTTESKHSLQQLQKLERLEQLERLERLQQLEQLERLERLQQLLQLHLTNLDYRAVEILPNSVVYCDIPYLNAAKSITYIANGFDHAAFYAWALSCKHPVFISEFSMPKEFKEVYSIDHINILGQSKERSVVIEKLYWNGKTL